jgi:hypothetical protein
VHLFLDRNFSGSIKLQFSSNRVSRIVHSSRESADLVVNFLCVCVRYCLENTSIHFCFTESLSLSHTHTHTNYLLIFSRFLSCFRENIDFSSILLSFHSKKYFPINTGNIYLNTFSTFCLF